LDLGSPQEKSQFTVSDYEKQKESFLGEFLVLKECKMEVWGIDF